jgi:hypothetical protein
MVDPVEELKTRAELLQARLASGDAGARKRLRALAEFARADDETLAAAASTVRRKHCLAVVAREHGFTSWDHARRVLEGSPGESDFGNLLYDTATGAHLNVWYAEYGQARAHLDAARREGARRYLLAYRTQFFVSEAPFIEELGLDPYDADWDAIDFDWVAPRDGVARSRLYGKRLDALRK